MEKEYCDCECDECGGNCTSSPEHHEIKKEWSLTDFRQMDQNVWSYEEENVKEFIRIILKEIEMIFGINKENGLKSGVSEKLKQEIFELCDGIQEEINIRIKNRAGDKLT